MSKANDKRGVAAVPPKSGPATPAPVASPDKGGGAGSPPINGAGGPAVAGTAEANAVIEAARRGRGRPPGSGGAPKSVAQNQAAMDAELQAIAQELYSSENFEDLVTLPGDIGFAMTGHDHWLPTEKTKRVLARSSAAAARLAKFDPRYLAFAIFISAMASHYGAAAIKTVVIKRQEKLKRQMGVTDTPTEEK